MQIEYFSGCHHSIIIDPLHIDFNIKPKKCEKHSRLYLSIILRLSLLAFESFGRVNFIVFFLYIFGTNIFGYSQYETKITVKIVFGKTNIWKRSSWTELKCKQHTYWNVTQKMHIYSILCSYNLKFEHVIQKKFEKI